MALAVKLTDLAANAACDAVTALLNSGYMRLYTGTQPATAATAITTQTLLGSPRFGGTAFGAASGGVATANAITSDTDAAASGDATWARLQKSDGTTSVMDCSVGVTGCDINLPTVTISQHGTIAIPSFTLGEPKSA